LNVRYRACSTNEITTTPIDQLEARDNLDGTYTWYICVLQGSSYSIPTCVVSGIEQTCPQAWIEGGSCVFNGDCDVVPTTTSTSTSTTSTTTTPPTTTTSTSTSTSTSTTSTTTEPPEFYYTGLICGGSIVGNFYSNTNLGDNPGIVYAFSATAGNTNQCFDNVSVTTTPNDNPILAIFEDCETCNNPTYYYYAVKKYDCANSCAYVSPDLNARSSTELSTTNGHYWNNGDGFVYQIQTTSESTSYDVDLDGAASNAVCSTACII
jgi:hypothetical protein